MKLVHIYGNTTALYKCECGREMIRSPKVKNAEDIKCKQCVDGIVKEPLTFPEAKVSTPKKKGLIHKLMKWARK